MPDNAKEEIDIKLKFPEQYRTLTSLEGIRVNSIDKGNIPISNFVKQKSNPIPGTLERQDSKITYKVLSSVQEGIIVDKKLQEVTNWINQQNFEEKYNVKIKYRGEKEKQAESANFLSIAFFGAIFIIMMTLLIQYNSFYYTILTMIAISFSIIGVFLGFIITLKPFGIIMGGIGIVALAGVVVNNNIVLIDTYIELLEKGYKPYDAILLTGGQRLRPVYLTTLTTMLGLLPMMFKLNIDFLNRIVEYNSPNSLIWVDLATAMVFGLLFASMLTLFVTPCGLLIYEQLKDKYSFVDRISKIKPRDIFIKFLSFIARFSISLKNSIKR